MSKRNLNYISRSFAETRSGLIDMIKQYYPNLLSDFNDASIASVFIDLNAAVTDLLSHHTDRMYQETKVEYAQKRNSLLDMARTMGVKVYGKRPSITVCDFTVTVPVQGGGYDATYLPIIRRGTQVSGAGKLFELDEDIDFSSPFASGGVPNRLVIPNIDSNGSVINYDIVKREIVSNGSSKIFKKYITPNESKPFHTVILSEQNILNIESIIVVDGNYSGTPTTNMFYDNNNRWYEVDALIESKQFMDFDSVDDVVVGRWQEINKKFITEFTGNGYLKVIFGGGQLDVNKFLEGNIDTNGVDEFVINNIGNVINNNALGEVLPAGSTLFIKYKVGGGEESNIGAETISKITFADISVNGSDEVINNAVRQSLKVNNPIPALGGRNEPSLEELRHLIKYNFASQNRAVTLKDYHVLVGKMPGKYGAPYRYGVMEQQNKIVINVLSKDDNNKLTDSISSALKTNISEFLSEYKMINDYVIVKSGKVINIGLDIDLMLEKNVSKSNVIATVTQTVLDYFNTGNFEMGEHIYLTNLIESIGRINGVLNVIDIKIKNKVGGGYSVSVSPQAVIEDDEYVIDYSEDQTLYSEINSMFEIKNPSDVRVRIK